jgi:transcriptional regulator with XRE-family HTH domain
VTDREREFLRRLGRRIRIERLSREWTQQHLGDVAGISRNFVSLLEQGGQGVDLLRLLRIADALGVALANLLPEVDRSSGGCG